MYGPGLLLKHVTRCTALFYLKPEGDFKCRTALLLFYGITFQMPVFAKGAVFQKGIVAISGGNRKALPGKPWHAFTIQHSEKAVNDKHTQPDTQFPVYQMIKVSCHNT